MAETIALRSCFSFRRPIARNEALNVPLRGKNTTAHANHTPDRAYQASRADEALGKCQRHLRNRENRRVRKQTRQVIAITWPPTFVGAATVIPPTLVTRNIDTQDRRRRKIETIDIYFFGPFLHSKAN